MKKVRTPDRFERMVEKAQDDFEARYLGKDQIIAKWESCDLVTAVTFYQEQLKKLKAELAQCQQERDGACNIVEGCNKLLLQQGQREARLMGAVTLLTTGEPGSFLAARFPATLRVARQALEEAGT